MGDQLGPVTAVPEMYFTWDKVSFDSLGLMQYITHAEFTTTVGRSKKSKSRRFRAGKTKVGSASLTFVIPDEVVAYNINRLLTVRSRPVISVGAKVEGIQGGKGVWMGSFKIDKVDWEYSPDGIVTLKITGLTNKVMGLAERARPRVFAGQTFLKILEKIAADHELELHPETRAELAARTEPFNIASPSGESDWSFIERLAISAGFSSMYLDESDTRDNLEHLRQLTDEDMPKSLMYSGESPSLKGAKKKTRRYTASNLKKTNLTGLDSTQGIHSDSPITNSDNFGIEYGAEYRGELINVTQAAAQISQTAKTMLRLGEQPGFLHHNKLSKKLGTFVIGYGPGVGGDAKGINMLAQEISVNIEGFKSGAAPATNHTKANGATSYDTAGFAPGVKKGGGSGGRVFRERGSLARHSGSTKASSTKKKRKAKGPNYLVRSGDDLPGSFMYRVYTSSVPDTVTKMHPSRKLAAIALANKFIPEVSVTLYPGVPHLQAGGRVRLVGTYAHDGVYGISECKNDWDPSSGLTTKLQLKTIPKGAKKKAGADKKGTGPSAGFAPGVKKHGSDGAVVEEHGSLSKAAASGTARTVLKKKVVKVPGGRITVELAEKVKDDGKTVGYAADIEPFTVEREAIKEARAKRDVSLMQLRP